MLSADPIKKHLRADRTIAGSPSGISPDDSFFSSKSPKLNEIRARHKALQISKNDLKPTESNMDKS